MIIEIYGKQGCSLCQSAKKKIGLLLDKWQIAEQRGHRLPGHGDAGRRGRGGLLRRLRHPLRAAQAGHDKVLARWDGQAPPSEELHKRLCA